MRGTSIFIFTMVMLLAKLSIAQDVPKPNKQQLAWQQAELVAVFHYDLHVFDDKQYNQAYNRITPIEDINIFNPEQLDTDQWIRSVKAMGAKIAILTATHETGFALYQSDVNPYSMKALKWRDGKGDIVRDFVNSCRKYGVKPGIYIGIRWNSFLGVHDFMMPNDGSKFQENRQTFYNKMCEGMTEELMSRYGDLAIVWYDGGGHGPELGGADILPIVEKYQKDIIFYHNSQRADIRWGGSETGTVSYPCWGTFTFPYSHSQNQELIFKDDFHLLKTGDPNGKYYMPAMSDAPLRGYNGRHEWFWEPGDEEHVFPLDNLMDMYYRSVGRNSTLILGITPDPSGLVPLEDSKRLAEFGRAVEELFSNPIPAKKSGSLEINFDKKQNIQQVVLSEDIAEGQRVRSFRLLSKSKKGWVEIFKGSSIGHKLIIKLDKPIDTDGLKLDVIESVGEPVIKNIYAYDKTYHATNKK